MGRKRRRQSSDESFDSDSDSEIETIVVNRSQKYGLRPRKTQMFPQDITDDENQAQSDFEDELEGGTLITTVRHEANQEPPSRLYKISEDCIGYSGGCGVGDENLIDFESFIDRTEIQVHKRKVQDPLPRENVERPIKRRGRKPKWMLEQEQSDGMSEFFHFLDTRDSKVEDFMNMTPEVDYLPEDAAVMQTTVTEIKCEAVETLDTDPAMFGTLIATCEQELIETEGPLESVKEEPPEYLDGVIDTTCEMIEDDKIVHSWSGITQAMADRSCFVESDDEVAVLRENSPKAKLHYLIIPKENLKSLSGINSKHITTIEHMYNAAKRIISYSEHKNHNFLIGFNALPSMIIYREKFLWLHLHVISDDMNFENLLLKKQWNAIHTSVFIHPEGKIFIVCSSADLIDFFSDVLSELREYGKMVSLPSFDECREILEGDVKCHKCQFVAAKFSAIKRHVLTEHPTN